MFTILQLESEDACGPDFVCQNETSAANNTAIKNGLIVFAPESSDELYYFDLSAPSASGEYPVRRRDVESATTEQFAPSFDRFMLRLIRQRAPWPRRAVSRETPLSSGTAGVRRWLSRNPCTIPRPRPASAALYESAMVGWGIPTMLRHLGETA